MTAPRRTVLFLLVMFSFGLVVSAQKGVEAEHRLVFHIRPTSTVFESGADVTLEFTLRNISRHRVLATKEASLHDLIYLDVLDDRGKKVSWRGRIVSRAYPPDFFVILHPGQSTTFRAVISLSDGSGYDISKAGDYRVQALFSLAPREYFASVSDDAVVPDRPINSNWTRFSVKAKSR